MKTNITKKQAKSLTKNTIKEPMYRGGSLEGLLYEPKKSRLTATNGYCLISYKVDADQNDSTGVLPVDLFKCTYEINGVAKRISNGSESTFNLIDEKYPDYESVIPENFTNKHEVVLNLDVLNQLFNAAIKDHKNNKHIKLTFNTDDSNSVIKYEQFCSDGGDSNYNGVIMPCRLNNEGSK